jgi:hypothetical protein
MPLEDTSNVSGSIGVSDQSDSLPSFHDVPRRNAPAPPAFAKFPAFPKHRELADADALMQLSPKKPVPQGLFEQLLQKRPEHILQSADEFPDRYNAQTLSLLRALYNNATTFEQLTAEEKELLNQATSEFFSATPAKPGTPPRASTPSTLTGTPVAAPKPQPVEGPVMDAFWWT